MITGFFLTIFYVLINFFVELLPIFDLPTNIVDGFALAWGYLASFSWLVPTTTLVACLTIAVLFHATLLGYDLSLKVYHMIRGK